MLKHNRCLCVYSLRNTVSILSGLSKANSENKFDFRIGISLIIEINNQNKIRFELCANTRQTYFIGIREVVLRFHRLTVSRSNNVLRLMLFAMNYDRICKYIYNKLSYRKYRLCVSGRATL